MRPVVDRLQLLDADMGVFLGGGQTGVPEHFLKGAEIGSAIEQVSRETVAERVG